MNNHLIEKINEYVGPNDTLIHLGDFCFARKDKYREMVQYYRNRINCRNVIIIWGNHDHPKDAYSAFEDSHMLVNTKVYGQKVTLCHYAMAVFDKSHRGAIHAYGHSHSTAERFMDEKFPQRRSMDVGVDNIAKLYGEYRPISFDEFKDRMNKNVGHAIDHHVVGKDVPTEEELMPYESRSK